MKSIVVTAVDRNMNAAAAADEKTNSIACLSSINKDFDTLLGNTYKRHNHAKYS